MTIVATPEELHATARLAYAKAAAGIDWAMEVTFNRRRRSWTVRLGRGPWSLGIGFDECSLYQSRAPWSYLLALFDEAAIRIRARQERLIHEYLDLMWPVA